MDRLGQYVSAWAIHVSCEGKFESGLHMLDSNDATVIVLVACWPNSHMTPVK
jgi:hypothetical protein